MSTRYTWLTWQTTPDDRERHHPEPLHPMVRCAARPVVVPDDFAVVPDVHCRCMVIRLPRCSRLGRLLAPLLLGLLLVVGRGRP